MALYRQIKTIGTFFGPAHLLFKNNISMKTCTNINESIISLTPLNSPGKTVYVIMWGRCSRNSERIILISFLRHTYYLTNFLNSRSNSNLEPSNSWMHRRIAGA
jgi:hypothetical protein